MWFFGLPQLGNWNYPTAGRKKFFGCRMGIMNIYLAKFIAFNLGPTIDKILTLISPDYNNLI